jgi:hypothetical protein
MSFEIMKIVFLASLLFQASSFKPIFGISYKALASISAATGTTATTTTVQPGGGDFKNAAEVTILRDEALKKILGEVKFSI